MAFSIKFFISFGMYLFPKILDKTLDLKESFKLHPQAYGCPPPLNILATLIKSISLLLPL